MYFFVEQFTCGICDASLSDSRTVFFSALPEGGGLFHVARIADVKVRVLRW